MSLKRSRSRKKSRKSMEYDWKLHDSYSQGSGLTRVLTRSQVGFNRIKNSESDMQLFANPRRYEPPGLPHLMVTMKGKWGSIPNTMITRSSAKNYPICNELCKNLDRYKKGRYSRSNEVTSRKKKRTRSRSKSRRR